MSDGVDLSSRVSNSFSRPSRRPRHCMPKKATPPVAKLLLGLRGIPDQAHEVGLNRNQKDHTVDVDEHLHPMSSIGVTNHYQWHPMTSVLQSWVNIRKSSFTTATCKKSSKENYKSHLRGWPPKSPAKIVFSHKNPIDFMYQAPNFFGQQVARQRKRIGTVICFGVQDS